MPASQAQRSLAARKRARKAIAVAKSKPGAKSLGSVATPKAREKTNAAKREISALRRQLEESRKTAEQAKKEALAALEAKELIGFSKSPKEMQKALRGLFHKNNFSAVGSLMELIMDPKASKKMTIYEKISVLKFLAEYEVPKPKSIDLEHSGGVEFVIRATQFSPRTAVPVQTRPAIPDEEYEEFEKKFDEPLSKPQDAAEYG